MAEHRAENATGRDPKTKTRHTLAHFEKHNQGLLRGRHFYNVINARSYIYQTGPPATIYFNRMSFFGI